MVLLLSPVPGLPHKSVSAVILVIAVVHVAAVMPIITDAAAIPCIPCRVCYPRPSAIIPGIAAITGIALNVASALNADVLLLP